MNEIRLLEVLEKIYSLSFLESILEIQKEEANYKKSNFFKQTKIPLSTLYEKFFIYKNSRYGFDQKINDFITNIDVNKLTDLALD
jgi:predicted transcriptional regulator